MRFPDSRTKCKGEIESIESWVAYGLLYTVINYEDGGYDIRSIHLEEVEHEFEYVPEGC